MNLSLLDRTLPFHLQLDHEARIIHAGPSLTKLRPDVCGHLLTDLLSGPDPELPDTTRAASSMQRLKFVTPDFGLRGEFIPVETGWIFASTLDPETASRIAELGLSASDFAANDLTIEFSMLKWSSDSQIAETRAALERLRESNKLRDSLRQETLTDSLTGIANRTRFVDTMEAAIVHGDCMHVMMIDLDRFKAINDLHGHHAGDGMLIAVASALTAAVGDKGLVARLGGDEFGVVLVGNDQCAAAPQLVRRIDALNGRPVPIDDAVLTMQLSVGHVRKTDETEAGALIRHADIAMYAARRFGESSVGVFDPAAQRGLELRRCIARDLPGAMASGTIEMYYQPIVHLADSHIHSYEVLSRWQHPDHGPIPPDLFVAVAESSRLVEDLDHFVVATAIREAAQSLTVRGERPYLSINISPLSLNDHLTNYLMTTLAETDFPASKLTIEVTETASIRDLEQTTRILSDLDRRGITVALDDFGTGFSSLAYLHQLPIGTLKIDRSFVMDLLDSRKAFEVVRSILHVAKSLDLPVVAEGIETIEQATMLWNLGCEFGQGYYFARPGPIGQARQARESVLPIRTAAASLSSG